MFDAPHRPHLECAMHSSLRRNHHYALAQWFSINSTVSIQSTLPHLSAKCLVLHREFYTALPVPRFAALLRRTCQSIPSCADSKVPSLRESLASPSSQLGLSPF